MMDKGGVSNSPSNSSCTRTGFYGYIVTMLPNRHDAEDVFQQTSLILWQKWDEFDPGRDFVAWACSVARNAVRNFLRRRGRDRLVFSEKLMNTISDLRLESRPILEERRSLLVECVKKLDFVGRQLLERCYAGRESMKAVAQQFHMTPNAVYVRLRRIRRELMDCIHRAVNQEDSP